MTAPAPAPTESAQDYAYHQPAREKAARLRARLNHLPAVRDEAFLDIYRRFAQRIEVAQRRWPDPQSPEQKAALWRAWVEHGQEVAVLDHSISEEAKVLNRRLNAAVSAIPLSVAS